MARKEIAFSKIFGVIFVAQPWLEIIYYQGTCMYVAYALCVCIFFTLTKCLQLSLIKLSAKMVC